MYCTYQHKINRHPRALQSVTADFCAYRLFSRFSRLAAPEAAYLELSGHIPACSILGTVLAHTSMFHLKLLINFISLSIAGSNWLARLGRNTQDRLTLCWSQADLQAHPKQILPACHVSDIFVPTHILACSVGPHNHHGGLQQQRHPYGALWRPTWWR